MKKQIKHYARFFKLAIPMTFFPIIFKAYLRDDTFIWLVGGLICSLLLSSFINSVVYVEDILEWEKENEQGTDGKDSSGN